MQQDLRWYRFGTLKAVTPGTINVCVYKMFKKDSQN